MLYLLAGCQAVDAVDAPPFVGKWRVIEGMTPEDAKAGTDRWVFKPDGRFQSRYTSPSWDTTMIATWSTAGENTLRFTNALVTNHFKAGGGSIDQRVDDFTCQWSFKPTGELVLASDRYTMVLVRIIK